jgi:hypothetical protein
MGRWIDWRVNEDLTAAEIEALARVVDGPLRKALPLIARQISKKRLGTVSLVNRLAIFLADRERERYAADPTTLIVTDGHVRVSGQVDPRDFIFNLDSGEFSGHSIGFQDYASIGILAAASQVTGKVIVTGGDDLSKKYIGHLISRLNEAGASLSPHANFMSQLDLGELPLE